MVTGSIISGSSAEGVLIIVYSLTNDSDVLYITSKAHQQGVSARINNLKVNNGSYGVAIFTLQGNRLPFSRVAALPQVVKYQKAKGAIACTCVCMNSLLYLLCRWGRRVLHYPRKN